MNKTIAAAAVAAALAAGGMSGMAFGTPSLAGAQTAAGEAADWVDEALSGLVSDGTITQDQADAVETALEDARPDRAMHGHPGHRLAVVADALGMTEDQLRGVLEGGRTIAEVAAAEGVDVQVVIDALVADATARLNEAVADGDLTREQADERLVRIEERVTAMVDGERPVRHARRGHHVGR
ncbi:MAG TPA: hypothetical protein VGE43_14760 [Acidimicrobiales bacterium]